MKQHTVALTEVQLRILLRLVRSDLKAGIHSAMTAGLPAKNKTFYVLGKVDTYVALLTLLTWRESDEDIAYRSLPTPVLEHLLCLVNEGKGADQDRVGVQELALYGASLVANLERAITAENVSAALLKPLTGLAN